ncbi:MAG TPA: helix-turn-helix domain-containing GNAT family N-acetyltransferase [Symbiobacteriaceae bacterium]|nr:helix-turn-helix domain-containing GNAT family N-acetyltransferase [Symbiobacteriaceae bacterium]
MAAVGIAQRVAAVRRFSRFYTQQIGMLSDVLLQSPFSLSEARVIYELAQRGETTAAELVADLGLDAGYLSRMLAGFAKRGLIEKRPSETDRRQSVIRLTDQGQEAFAGLNSQSRQQVEGLLSRLSDDDQARLVAAMTTVEELLGARPEPRGPYLLRPHRPGDMGWVVHRHGVLYSQEYGWDEQFEALVAHIAGDFIQHFDPKRERCWIAEKDGEVIGSVFLVKKSETVAKLRLLLVEPKARGLGLGRRLVEECIRFARQAGYKQITLWTNSCLLAARRIYERTGFRLVHSEPNREFGEGLISETWELDL